MPALPQTETELYQWIAVLMGGYLALALFLQWWCSSYRHRQERAPKPFMAHVFNSATFSASVTVLFGVWDPAVLALLGSPKPFLVIAALAGIGYSIRDLY